MKVLSRKIYLVAILAVMAIASIWLGISMQINPVGATSTSLLPEDIKVVNIEDVVDDITNGRVTMHSRDGGAQSNYLVYSSTNKELLNTVLAKTGDENKTVNLGIYTRAGKETDKAGDYITNTSKYDGNISMYSSGSRETYVKFIPYDSSVTNVESVRNATE